jgi:TMEM175 potassium channel family protein
MSKGRLEAFSDGVLAIIITIMVLELKPPHEASWESLRPLVPVFVSYILSFLYVGIYWNNHHHLLQAVRFVDGRVLWANLHLLFWLSLAPFVTNWVGDASFGAWPVAAYGIVFLCAAVAYTILVRTLLMANGPDSLLAKAIGSGVKEKVSMAVYMLGIVISLWSPTTAYVSYWIVALIWLFPDQRIERQLLSQ